MGVEQVVAAAAGYSRQGAGKHALADEHLHRGDARRVDVDHDRAGGGAGADGQQAARVQPEHLGQAVWVERRGVKTVTRQAGARLHLRRGGVLGLAGLAVRHRRLRRDSTNTCQPRAM